MLLIHGARVVSNYDDTVTHVVVHCVEDRAAHGGVNLKIASPSANAVVVSSNWVDASIAEGTLLSEGPFQLGNDLI